MLLWTLGCMYFFQISVFIFFRYIPRNGIADYMVVLLLVFWRTSLLFCTVAAPIYVPINRVSEGSLFSTSWPVILCAKPCFLFNSPPWVNYSSDGSILIITAHVLSEGSTVSYFPDFTLKLWVFKYLKSTDLPNTSNGLLSISYCISQLLGMVSMMPPRQDGLPPNLILR